MRVDELEQRAIELETEIQKANQSGRLKLQPQFSRILSALSSTGSAVPGRLRSLDFMLREEAVEDLFDNMPV